MRNYEIVIKMKEAPDRTMKTVNCALNRDERSIGYLFMITRFDYLEQESAGRF